MSYLASGNEKAVAARRGTAVAFWVEDRVLAGGNR